MTSLFFCGCRERCGVIKIRQPGLQRHWRDRDALFQGGLPGLKRLTRKRYIDLGNERTASHPHPRHSGCRGDRDPSPFLVSVADEAGPGPIKSKYEAPDFDALLKEAQKTMQR